MEQTAERKENKMGIMPVGRLLFQMSLPMVISMVIQALYNIVDSMYVSQINEDALTAVSLVYPMQTLMIAIATGTGVGINALLSRSLGRKDYETANSVALHGVSLALISGVLFSAASFLLAEAFMGLQTSDPEIFAYGVTYMRICCTLCFGVFLQITMERLLTSTGRTLLTMFTQGLGAVINIILDPILMFGFDMGVQGAALATIISQGLSAVWILIFLSSRRSFLKLKLCNLRISPAILAPCIALGASPFVMQFTESILNICFNVSLRAYGGDIAVGVMAVLSSVMQFALLPITGMTQGSQPIVSYNYGAGKLDRVRSAFFNLLKCSVAYAVILWALAMLFPQIFMHMFTTDPNYIAMGTWAMRVYTAGICVMGVQYACQQTFVALGNARTSLCLALLRKVILLIPLIFILPHILTDHKVFAVFLAEPVADILAAATTAALFFRYLKKIMKSGGKQKG